MAKILLLQIARFIKIKKRWKLFGGIESDDTEIYTIKKTCQKAKKYTNWLIKYIWIFTDSLASIQQLKKQN